MMEWIKVTDGLPEKTGRYIVYTKNEINKFICMPVFFHKAQLWDIESEITHWMPLPEPPKE